MEHVDGIAIITLDGHRPHLVRSKIVWSTDEIFLVLTDPNDGLLYGYEEYEIEGMRFGDKNAVVCKIAEPLIREDEVNESEGTDTVKVYLSRSGFRNVLGISQELSIPAIPTVPATPSNLNESSSDSSEIVVTKKQKPDTDTDEDDSDYGTEDMDTNESEVELSDPETESVESTEPEVPVPEVIDPPKRRGWFSWLW